MPTGSGLDYQCVAKLESVWGTAVTPDKAFEVNEVKLVWDPSYMDGQGMRVGTKYQRSSRTVKTREEVGGSLTLEHSTRLMGTLWRAALGSTVTTPTLVLGSAYKQVHNPGDFLTKSLTIQLGEPEASGTVRPRTISGCKVVGWEFKISEGGNATLMLSIDGKTESTATALVTATYVAAAGVFGFGDITVFKLGGTVAGTTELTVTGGVTPTSVVKGITIKGTVPMATDRFGLGAAGQKAEQLENGIPTITVELDAEWNRTDYYDNFKNNTPFAMELKFEGTVISGTDKNTLHFVCPSLRLMKAAPEMNGADVLRMKLEAKAYTDDAASTTHPIMVKLISADSTTVI